MGNRTYLMIKTDPENQEVLFEGNNSLAYFWLLLLEKHDIERVKPAFQMLYETADESMDGEPIDTDIRISRSKALQNGAAHRSYIGTVYPALLPLYDEWLAYLAAAPSHDDILYIDLEEFSGFYANVNQFLEELLSFYTHVKEGAAYFEPVISSTTGWEAIGRKQFYEFSAHYRSTPETIPYRKRITSGQPISAGYKLLLWIWGIVSVGLFATGIYAITRFQALWSKVLAALVILAGVLLLIIGGFTRIYERSQQKKAAP
ncbi:hypothetical protein [Chitinophaga sp. HK235]|uniref:hypothetical protein n=1 Tax=Chitinophaga sp. HK235 TaxID=2952571 RepID=UPI001BA47CFE|nr:hypothetical protein [Chitinophaga sp. HK235]